MSDDPEEEFSAHAELIGHVTIAWNDLTQILFWLFEHLSGMPENRADAIFFAVRNDRTQRQMLKRLTKVALAAHPKHCEDLLTALKLLDKHAETRNEVTHSAWAVEMAWREDEKGEPIEWAKPRLVKMRIGDDGFKARFEQLRVDLTDTYSKLFDVWKIVNKITF